MRVNIDRQMYYGISALVLQFLSEHEDLVEDEDLQVVVKKLKSVVKAPLRTYYLANPKLRLIMKRLLPALRGEKNENTVLEIQPDAGDRPTYKDGRTKRLVNKLLGSGKLDESDHDFLCEVHGLELDYTPPETYEEHKLNLPLKYLGVGEKQ